MESMIKLINSKEYGAEELQKSYRKYFLKGLIIAAAFHIVLTISYLGISMNLKAEEKPNNQLIYRQIDLKDLEYPVLLDAKEPEAKKEVPVVVEKIKPVKDLKALEVEPVRQKDAEVTTIKTQGELEKVNAIVSKNGDSTGNSEIASNVVVIPEKETEVKIDNNVSEKNDTEIKNTKATYFEYEVEKAPEAVNLSQIKSQMEYPNIAKQAGIEGRVSVRVLVDENGKVIKTGKMTGPDVFYDVVREGAGGLRFTPGIQASKPVKVWVTVPFNFRLDN